ncbi:MAG: 3-ketosteroid-delta-1-dehydrogenase [Mobilicoccus sp.]|nr:3-ketosteroid-delta-1-dehydrogenase [Mobilicoccus sp.]
MGHAPLPPVPARDMDVDMLVVGSGTGMFAALAAADAGLSVVLVEKTAFVGGSTALSGGAFWIPGNSVLREAGSHDTTESARVYLDALVGDAAPRERYQAYVEHGPAAVDLLRSRVGNRFIWGRGYADYHPEYPGGSAAGRSVESGPFDARVLGEERRRLIPPTLVAPVPMPITSGDYRAMNLMGSSPVRALPKTVARAVQGIGGLALRREYVATGQALGAGLYRAVLDAGIPVWTCTDVDELLAEDGRVVGAVLSQEGRRVTVRARRGVVLATGGFDHNATLRSQVQSDALDPAWPLGATGNTGDALTLGRAVGADVAGMDQAWWFPAIAPVGGASPSVMLAERSLPGSFLIDQHGQRFINESIDYMSFGQEVLRRERDGDPVGRMWIVFDQRYRDSYVFGATAFPRAPLPKAWYEAGIAHRADSPAALAAEIGVDVETFTATMSRFDEMAARGRDEDFHRGESAYDRYYGDPAHGPNPNLRPLSKAPWYAVEVVLSDLGTCGGLRADEHARVLREDGSPIDGLYAIGNAAANAFGNRYPGAGATIGQGLVFGYLAAQHAARS